jgi:hypothetical protein
MILFSVAMKMADKCHKILQFFSLKPSFLEAEIRGNIKAMKENIL